MSRIRSKFINSESATSGQVLTADGAGSATFQNPSAGISGSFSAANNQLSATNVTGLAFSNASYRSFSSQVSVTIDATSDLFEHFTLKGIQRGSDWVLEVESFGDSSGFVFTITTVGQVQYTNGNYSGFVSAVLKFVSATTPV